MKKPLGIISIALLGFVITGCGNKQSSDTAASSENGVQAVKVAHTQAYKPYDFVNEQGESDGFEVAVMKAVDELLPDYTFEFVPTSDDDLLIGVESGKYDVGTKGAWLTEERKEKYVLPEEAIAASIVGITIRAEDQATITDLESFAKASGKLVPIAPQSAQYAVIEDFNAQHPDTPIDLVASESFTLADAYAWVVEERYDAYFDIKLSFQNSVEAEDAPYHNLQDQLAYVPYKGISTYPLFNKKQQSLADDYDQAIKKLREDGTLAKLSEEYFGENVFEYVTE